MHPRPSRRLGRGHDSLAFGARHWNSAPSFSGERHLGLVVAPNILL